MSTATQTLPEASTVELSPTSAFAQTGGDEVVVFMGPAGGGTINRPTFIGARDIATLVATFKNGPAVKEAAKVLSLVGSPIVFLRTATATVAATKSTPVITSATLAGFVALSGTPLDGGDYIITCTTGGTTGTSYSYTLTKGGVTGAPVSVTTALTITTGLDGVTVTLTTGKVITAGDTIEWLTTAASSTVLPLTFTGTGTSAITVTGTPLDAYEAAFRVVAGCTIGTTGGTYEYTLDYGSADPTWTPVTALGTATTLLLIDGPLSTESTGLTLNFAAGTLVAGDLLVFNTTAPAFDSAGAIAALTGTLTTGLINSNLEWTWVRAVGDCRVALASALDSIVTGWDALNKPSWLVCDVRARGTSETLASWSASVDTEFGPYNSTRVAVAKGRARLLDPVNGRSNLRSSMLALMPRAMTYPMRADWGQFDRGPLGADVTITDVNQQLVEYDGNADPNGVKMGFLALRRWPNYTGIYPAGAVLLAPGTDIQRIPLRRIMNKAKKLQQGIQQLQVLINFPRNEKGVKPPLVEGDATPATIKKINRLAKGILDPALVSTGEVSGYTFALNPTPVDLGGGAVQLTFTLKIRPIVFVVKADGTTAYESATLTV